MAVPLNKELKRALAIGDEEFTLIVDPDGLRLVEKGKRKPRVQLRWVDIVSGDAALATALNASVKPPH